jgi:hypothetical protein
MHAPLTLFVAATIEEDRHRGEARRHAYRRARADARAGTSPTLAGLRAAILHILRRDHSLTDYPCRLPDGRIGWVAVVLDGGEWVLVCRVA